ncbi:MAG: histidine phosphatase family protein [Firmicutes bacterium]|nr:histidine phosphatase family protein [Bacillota bacterium]
MSARELLMLRHGATEHNEKRLFTGAQDVPLSAKGRAALAPLRGTYPPASRFFTSGMRRAVETLCLLYGDVPHTDIAELMECRFGAFENRSHDDLYANEPLYRAWAQGERELVLPGGESRAAFDRRVLEGFRMLAGQPWEGLAVLVSHGGVLRALIALLDLTGGEPAYPPPNACGWRVRLSDAGQVVDCEAYP